MVKEENTYFNEEKKYVRNTSIIFLLTVFIWFQWPREYMKPDFSASVIWEGILRKQLAT